MARTRSPRREQLAQAVVALQATMLDVTPEALELARHYHAARVVPPRFQDDLLHVAVAVCQRMEMIVSWNMKHLANPNRVTRINAVNRAYGWPMMRIHTPQEVLGL